MKVTLGLLVGLFLTHTTINCFIASTARGNPHLSVSDDQEEEEDADIIRTYENWILDIMDSPSHVLASPDYHFATHTTAEGFMSCWHLQGESVDLAYEESVHPFPGFENIFNGFSGLRFGSFYVDGQRYDYQSIFSQENTLLRLVETYEDRWQETSGHQTILALHTDCFLQPSGMQITGFSHILHFPALRELESLPAPSSLTVTDRSRLLGDEQELDCPIW